jgi:hypothetical protein
MRGRKRLFTDTQKWCNRCKKWLPLDAFGENKRTASGKQDYCKTCHNAYCGTFWNKVTTYDTQLHEKYEMTPNEYLELWRSQGQKCLVCGSALALYNRSTHIRVLSGVKKLLCTNCDRGLECFKNDSKLLVKAASEIDKAANDAGQRIDSAHNEADHSNEGPSNNNQAGSQ